MAPAAAAAAGLPDKPKAFERQHSEVVFQQRDGMVRSEDPVIKRSLRIAALPARIGLGG